MCRSGLEQECKLCLKCRLVSVRAGRVNNTLLKSGGLRKKYSSSGSGGHLILNLPFFFLNVETFRHNPGPVFKSLKHL